MEKKEKKSKKNIFLTIIIILFIIMVLLFVFRNNIESQYKGVDVKYINDPLYCEQDSDCAQGATCGPINIFNYEKQHYERSICGVSCVSNQCRYNDCEVLI